MGKNTIRVGIVLLGSIIATSLLWLSITYYPEYFSFLDIQPKEVCALYDKEKRIITVTCNSTLSDVGRVVPGYSLKKESPEGIWFLNSSLAVLKGATLTINPSDAKWLKISSVGTSVGIRELLDADQDSNESTPYGIHIFGSFDINGVKVTSWDPRTDNYTNQGPEGMVPRPYIAIEEGSNSSHIADSEIAYLGYNNSRRQGLSFYGGDNSTLTGNRIHDLWYGFISVNVGHIIIENNRVYNNFRYGIDPHMGSHDMVVRDNYIYDNRIGLICSECSNVIFEKNRIVNNNEIGLMFSRNTVNSSARDNKISLSDVGISISDSYLNKVYGNDLLDNKVALAIKDGSSNNFPFNNTISRARECGILVVEAHNNTVQDNYIENYHGSGICLTRGAILNLFYSNEIDGLGKYGIDVRDGAKENSFFRNMIHLAGNAIRVYNNTETLFVDNKVGTTNNHQYIISGNSVLNLVKTQFLGDRIRAAGAQPNVIKIWNSGTISIVTEHIGNSTETLTYDTDEQPYIAKVGYMTIKLYSKIQ
jgi:parallel beta-helix repeat protein